MLFKMSAYSKSVQPFKYVNSVLKDFLFNIRSVNYVGIMIKWEIFTFES